MKKKSTIDLFFVFTLFLVNATMAVQAEDYDGKAIFLKYKCNMCHAVSSSSIKAQTMSDKMSGSDLSGYRTDGLDLYEIVAYLNKERDIDGKTHKKTFKGTYEELQTILDWLGSE